MFRVTRPAIQPASLAARKSYSKHDVVQALALAFHNKCYICETKEPTSLNVEHFIAHQEDDDKKYDWNNLFFCCGRCNNLKNKFFNNLINCTDPTIDPLRKIRHAPPVTPFAKSLLIEAKDSDPKTIETADLIDKIFNEDNTGNKKVSSTYLRKKVYLKYTKLLEKINTYIDDESTMEQKSLALEKIRTLMSKEQEYSAFLRWAIIDSPDLYAIVGDAID